MKMHVRISPIEVPVLPLGVAVRTQWPLLTAFSLSHIFSHSSGLGTPPRVVIFFVEVRVGTADAGADATKGVDVVEVSAGLCACEGLGSNKYVLGGEVVNESGMMR